MKKFMLRLSLFSAVVFLLIFLLGVEIEKKNYDADYMAAMNDKHHRLDKTTGPRIIFVGGSSTAFGVDCKEVERAFNIPATNLALMAGLGLDFMLNEIEDKMRAGDIIILSTEYYLSLNGSYELKVYTAKCSPEAAHYFRRDYARDFTTVRFKQIKNNFNYLFKKNQPLPDTSTDFTTAYIHRTDLNEYGDMIGHIGKRPPPKLFYKDDYFTYRYYNGIARLNKFYEAAQKKNAKVFFVYHAYAESAYQINKETINRYHADMVRNLKFPVIGEPADFVYDDSLFFDTALHLNPEGREMRTKKLILLLQALRAKGYF
jgi:hypothetical protein